MPTLTSSSHIEDPAQYRRLDLSVEKPGPQSEYGIDAEFVLMQQAEIEIRSDGTSSTLRPGRSGLGRVSVVRSGHSKIASSRRRSSSQASRNCEDHEADIWADALEVPPQRSRPQLPHVAFIDDYIAVPERIVDYLTQFSGISPGDLDPDHSPHVHTGHLIHLKHAYKKIWILLNLGVTFVGHGLKKDFRTINIHVPKNQVIDTVELFHRKGTRQLSLRFLIWLLLGEKVQDGQHGHDSIEDARAALRLWEKYQELERKGNIDRALKDIYREGQKTGYKVPEIGEAPKFSAGQRPMTPNVHELEQGRGGSMMDTPGLTPAGTPQSKPALLVQL